MERLWERIREGRKETNSKAEYLEPGRSAWETRRERTGKTEGAKARAAHCGSHCEAEAGREGKEAQRLSSQNPKLKRTKERENSGGQKVDWIAAIGRVKVRPREVGSESGRQG